MRATALQLLGAEGTAAASYSRPPFSSTQEVDQHRALHGPALEDALVRSLTEVLMQEREPGAVPLHAVAQLMLEDARPALGHKIKAMDLYSITEAEYLEFKADWETLDTNQSGTLSLEEVKKLLGSQADLDAMMERFDVGVSGSVTFDEYLRAMCLNQPSPGSPNGPPSR